MPAAEAFLPCDPSSQGFPTGHGVEEQDWVHQEKSGVSQVSLDPELETHPFVKVVCFHFLPLHLVPPA